MARQRPFKTEEDVREYIEERMLKRPIDEDIWQFVTREKWPADVIDVARTQDEKFVHGDLESLKGRILRLEELIAKESSSTPKPFSSAPPRDLQSLKDDERWEIISLLLSQEAAKAPKVRRFWKEEGLDEPVEDVEGWIREHTVNMDVVKIVRRIARGVDGMEEDETKDKDGDRDWESLHCPDSDGQPDKIIRIPKSGLLFRLKRLAQKLERDYGWREYQAVYFLLTKKTPRRVYAGKALYRSHPLYPCLDRVLLEVSPVLAPREVSKLYQQIWRDCRKKRFRRFSKKTYDLIRFVVGRGAEMTWGDRSKIWNQLYPPVDERRKWSGKMLKKVYHRAVDALGAKRKPLEVRYQERGER